MSCHINLLLLQAHHGADVVDLVVVGQQPQPFPPHLQWKNKTIEAIFESVQIQFAYL